MLLVSVCVILINDKWYEIQIMDLDTIFVFYINKRLLYACIHTQTHTVNAIDKSYDLEKFITNKQILASGLSC